MCALTLAAADRAAAAEYARECVCDPRHAPSTAIPRRVPAAAEWVRE